MSSSVFISYSRRNWHFAERLQIDLRRAGIDAWRDVHNLRHGEDWEKCGILPAIAARSHLVLLASPEAEISPWVNKEVTEAQRLGKTILPLRLAGKPGKLLADWERLHMEDARAEYWGPVRRLAASLNASGPVPRNLVDLFNARRGDVTEAAAELGGPVDELSINGRKVLKLPVGPSGYCMTWLFAPKEALLGWPDSLGVLFNFTNRHPGSRHEESLNHWAAQPGVTEPWLVMVEGPINRETMNYEVNANSAHEWEDSLHAGLRVIEEFAKRSKKVGYYFNCLLPLVFELGARSTMLPSRRRVYHYNARSGEAGYQLAYDGWQ